MTFIKPSKNNAFLNRVLVVLGVMLAVEVFGMVALYNMTVSASHNIALAKAQLDAIGAQTIDMNNKITVTLGESGPLGFAAGAGLVTESKPRYFQVKPAVNQSNPQWPIASHY